MGFVSIELYFVDPFSRRLGNRLGLSGFAANLFLLAFIGGGNIRQYPWRDDIVGDWPMAGDKISSIEYHQTQASACIVYAPALWQSNLSFVVVANSG